MQLYANPNRPDHADNNAAFLRVVNDFPELNLYQPSPDKAPWHWQARIEAASTVILNFWPHTLKGQIDGQHSVEGEREIHDMIGDAFSAADEEPFDVIED